MKRKFLGISLVFIGVAAIGLVLGIGSYFHSFQFLLNCQDNFFCQPATVSAAPSAYELEAKFCARHGKVWDESKHGCVAPYVFADPGPILVIYSESGWKATFIQRPVAQPALPCKLQGTVTNRDRVGTFLVSLKDNVLDSSGMEANGNLLVLNNPVAGTIAIKFEGNAYRADLIGTKGTTTSVRAEAEQVFTITTTCAGINLKNSYMFDGKLWFLVSPMPEGYENVQITVDRSGLPTEVRQCVSFSYVLVDNIVVRGRIETERESFEALAPQKPGGIHELSQAKAVHQFFTPDGNFAYETVAWALKMDILTLQPNIVRIDQFTSPDELKTICTK